MQGLRAERNEARCPCARAHTACSGGAAWLLPGQAEPERSKGPARAKRRSEAGGTDGRRARSGATGEAASRAARGRAGPEGGGRRGTQPAAHRPEQSPRGPCKQRRSAATAPAEATRPRNLEPYPTHHINQFKSTSQYHRKSNQNKPKNQISVSESEHTPHRLFIIKPHSGFFFLFSTPSPL